MRKGKEYICEIRLKRNRFFFLPSRKEKTENGQKAYTQPGGTIEFYCSTFIFFFFSSLPSFLPSFPPPHSPRTRDSFIESREAVCFSTKRQNREIQPRDRLSALGTESKRFRSRERSPPPLLSFRASVGCQIR